MPSPRMSTSPRCSRSSATSGSWPDLERDPVELGHAGLEVVGVALEHEPLAERPFRQLEGAGADRVLAEVGAVLVDLLLGHGVGEVDRHDVEEGGVRPRQLEHDRVRIGHLDARDRAEEAGAGALRGGVQHALDRILDVLGRQLAAVVELHAGAQLEGVGLPVGRDLVALGQVRHELHGAGLVVHQPVEQALDDRPVLPVVADRRVERGDVVLVGDDHLRRPAWAPGPWPHRPTRARAPGRCLRAVSSFDGLPVPCTDDSAARGGGRRRHQCARGVIAA